MQFQEKFYHFQPRNLFFFVFRSLATDINIRTSPLWSVVCKESYWKGIQNTHTCISYRLLYWETNTWAYVCSGFFWQRIFQVIVPSKGILVQTFCWEGFIFDDSYHLTSGVFHTCPSNVFFLVLRTTSGGRGAQNQQSLGSHRSCGGNADHVILLILWVVPPPSNSHHQDSCAVSEIWVNISIEE